MKMRPLGSVFCFALTVLMPQVRGFAVDSVEISKFLNRYCVDCHGADEPEAERNLGALPDLIGGENDLVDYQDIVDQLNLGEMPPQDADQPNDELRGTIVSLLQSRIDQYHASRDTSVQPSLRRLNRREYLNSVRDLFSIDMTMFDPTVGFPMDQQDEHLDTIGDTLVMSAYLLDGYLGSAEHVLSKAIQPLERPTTRTWTFTEDFRQQPEIDNANKGITRFKWLVLYDVPGADKPEGAYAPIHAFDNGVPQSGVYEIRVDAEALHRDHPYDNRLVGTDRTERLRLGVVAGHKDVGPLHLKQPIQPLLAEVDLNDGRHWVTLKVRLDRGFTPRFIFPNGLMDVRGLWTKLVREYPDRFPKIKKKGIVEYRKKAIEFGKLPQIRLHEVQIRGPIETPWPTPAQRRLLGEDFESLAGGGTVEIPVLRRHVTRLASRAYRRSPTQDEISRLMNLLESRVSAGKSQLDAFCDVAKAVICSPNFLYLNPPAKNGTEAEALAARLSYFFWASVPDRNLIEAARSGELATKAGLISQTQRMIADKKSEAMIRGFLDGWLTLRDLGATPPDRGTFRDYYRFDLESATRRETELFTRHLIDENLSPDHFLDARFTFANRSLARFYGLDELPKSGFQRVDLKPGQRGGLLGQASVLTVTANGIETSPVVRGVWLLENLLGDPPSPPPPDVEPLDPDIRGAKTVRDQLEMHRSNASCNSCHREIDPLGFALENFNAIGQWRDRYRRGPKVDVSGVLPDGQSFDDLSEFKHLLMQRKEQFLRTLVSKMLSYASGRRMGPLDRPEVDRIVEQVTENNGGMRDLIELVVTSKPFSGR